MNTQSLRDELYRFFSWHPARIQTFADLIFAIIKSKTVRIKEMAMHVTSSGELKAKISKVERLFLLQEVCYTIIGKLILQFFPNQDKIIIAIDRTNWKFGEKDINFFVAAMVYGNLSIPFAWSLLDKKGNSSTQERKDLIEQILKIIPLANIKLILADREFVGEDWFEYLSTEQKIPFAIRIKKSEQIKHENGGKMALGKYLEKLQEGERKAFENKLYSNRIEVKISCLKLKNGYLIIASNLLIGNEVLLAYKRRWSIERTFKSLKTSGFNFEDTHMTDPKKLAKLLALASIALAICVIAGEIKSEMKIIKTKNHGRKLVSLFTYGFDWLREYLANQHNSKLAELYQRLKYRLYTVVQ